MINFILNGLTIHDLYNDISNVGYAIHTPVSGLDFPAIRLATQDKPGEHGASVMNQLYAGRLVHLTGLIWFSNIADFDDGRRLLSSAIRIVKNNYISAPLFCKFINDDGLALQFYAYAQAFKMDLELPIKANFMLDLFAPDPNLYNQTPTTDTLFRFDSHNEDNNGDANSYLLATFTGPLTNPILTNAATSETFKLDYTLGGGDVIVVDMAAKTIVLNGSTNLNSAFDVNNTWLSLVPATNTITLNSDSGGDTGNVLLSWRDAWIGV